VAEKEREYCSRMLGEGKDSCTYAMMTQSSADPSRRLFSLHVYAAAPAVARFRVSMPSVMRPVFCVHRMRHVLLQLLLTTSEFSSV
jgi:hypothetical protein